MRRANIKDMEVKNRVKNYTKFDSICNLQIVAADYVISFCLKY